MRRAAFGVEVEDHPLTLAQHAEDRSVDRVRREFDLRPVLVEHEDAHSGAGVVRLHHALHGIRTYARHVGSSEFQIVERLRERFPHVGDDAAVLGRQLFAADAIVEGVDFTPDTDRKLVGYHAVKVNVSDIAAMGGVPLYVLVTICAPEGTDIDAIIDGVAEAARDHYPCQVIGGDLSRIDGPLVVSVAIVGQTVGSRAVMRSGARPGDVIYLSGEVGRAAARGYALVKFPARVEMGKEANIRGATAMIDVSDGLIADLNHICDASNVGAVLEIDPPERDGDDYELLFTLPPDQSLPIGCIRVGTIVEDPSVRPTAPGWEHHF
jgi:thiamine-monophosphate kinase